MFQTRALSSVEVYSMVEIGLVVLRGGCPNDSSMLILGTS